MAMKLLDGGQAYLVDFPQGRSIQDEDGYYCVDGVKAEPYTGKTTWKVRNGFSVFVTFEDSEILVSSDANFGEADWTELAFDACDVEQTWRLVWFCGDSGYGPDDSVFRNECPPEALEH
jgi:hypothetical protein